MVIFSFASFAASAAFAPPGSIAFALSPARAPGHAYGLLIGHEGGWDEIGLVAVPLVVVAALLFIANRRAKAALASRSDTAEPESGVDPSP